MCVIIWELGGAPSQKREEKKANDSIRKEKYHLPQDDSGIPKDTCESLVHLLSVGPEL